MLRFGFLFLACAATTAAAQLRYESREPIVLRDGAGSAAFTLTNIGNAPIPLALRTGPFSDDTSQMTLAAPKVTFAWDAGAAMPSSIGPGAALRIEASVSNLNGAGAASATLFNGAAELGRVHVIETDAPLDVSIIGQGSPDQKLTLAAGDSAVLTVRNGDAETYPLDWTFQLEGKVLQSGELQLAPHGTSRIELMPTDDLYSWADNLRPSSKTGLLTLSLHGPPEVAKELLPERTLPVNLLMRKLSASQTSLWSHIFVTLVLLLGGLLSLAANSILPNILRKISLRRQVNDLADPTGSVSPRVDPYLRALLKLEWKRIDWMLKRSWAFSLSSVETLDLVSAGVDRLSKRLKVTERLEELGHRLEDASMSAPPSVTEEIGSKLQMAANHLHSFALADEDANPATRLMDAADKSLNSLGDADALARMIASNFRDLKMRQKFLPYSYYNDLKAALPGLFEMLNQPFDDFRNIPRQMTFAIDYGIAALQMAFDYAILRLSAPAVVGLGSGPGPSARDRLIAHHQELVGLLGTLSWAALRSLRALVQEMRENTYERDVLEEIGTPGQAEIAVDPHTVRPYVPLLFSIRFKDPRFNDAAAIRRLSCTWDFPGELVQQDWKACHFFDGSELTRGEGRDVTVSVKVESQRPVEAATSPDNTGFSKSLRSSLSSRIEIQKVERLSSSRAFAEGVRFLIAFGVALAGLFSGALQQLEKLDFLPATIAILALGFGADTIKNLLTQTSKKAVS